MSHNSLRITNAFFFTNLMKLQKLDLVREESSFNWIVFFPNLTVIKGRLREIKKVVSGLLGRNGLENFYERPRESPDMIGFSLKNISRLNQPKLNRTL